MRHAAMPCPLLNDREHVEALTAHHTQLAEWAENCPENFQHRAALVGAEIARIEGRELDAERLYEAAIRSAQENDFVHIEALANELAARFYAARGFETISQAYLRNARYGYLRWGADGKVRQLDQLHPHLRPEETGAAADRHHRRAARTARPRDRDQGVASRLRRSRPRTIARYADAYRDGARGCRTRALDALARDRAAHRSGSHNRAAIRSSCDLCDEPATGAVLPETVLHYVLHTRESVILDDAAIANAFSSDPYIRQRHARSVLCLPVSNQGHLIGVLYLENHLAPGVFAPARIVGAEAAGLSSRDLARQYPVVSRPGRTRARVAHDRGQHPGYGGTPDGQRRRRSRQPAAHRVLRSGASSNCANGE